LLYQFGAGDIDETRLLYQDRRILQNDFQGNTKGTGVKPPLDLSTISQSTKKQDVTTTSIGAHINSDWSGKGSACLEQSGSYLYFDAGNDISKSVINGKQSSSYNYKSWSLDFVFWSHCNALTAKLTYGSIYDNGGKLVVDLSLQTGSFTGTYKNTTLTTELCKKVCYENNGTIISDDQAIAYCEFGNCTIDNIKTGHAVVSGSWTATGLNTTTSSSTTTSDTHYTYVDNQMTNLRGASVKLLVKIGGKTVHFPAAAKLAKTGSLDHSTDEYVYTKF
jgi:hypothetical protein